MPPLKSEVIFVVTSLVQDVPVLWTCVVMCKCVYVSTFIYYVYQVANICNMCDALH